MQQKHKGFLAALSAVALLAALLWTVQPVDAQGGYTNFDNVTISGDLLVGDDGALGGNLSVAGTLVAASFVTASGDVEFPANLVVSDTLTLGNDLVVADDGLVIGDAILGTLVVSGTSNLVGNLSDSGGALTVADNVMIDGAADAVQLTVQGNATNTNNLLVVENSAGTDQFSVSNVGLATVAGDLAVADDVTVNDLTVADFANITAQSVLTLTMNGWLTPTGSLQPIAAAGAVSIDGGTRMGHTTDYLMLVNIGTQTITISETTGLVSAGNVALGAGDGATFIWANNSWYQIGSSNN